MIRPLAACLVPLAIVFGCAPKTTVISADRTVAEVPCTRHSSLVTAHCFEVTDTWMQERYQLERALRLRLEQQSADKTLPEFGK